MSSRLATRLGLPASEDRLPGALDLVRFHEPATGSLVRTKGSLFLLAQLTGGDAHLARAAGEALEQLQHDYYYDLSAGSLGALGKALANANRRLYHQRGRLGIPRRAGVSIIAMAIRGREAHVAKLGPAAAVILREDRMYELPPPPAVHEEDPRVRRAPRGRHAGRGARDHALHLAGRAGARRPAGAGQPQPGPGGRGRGAEARAGQPAPVGRGGAPGAPLPDPRRVAARTASWPSRSWSCQLTATTRQLEPVRPSEPLAGLPDQSPVPLADAIGRFLHRMGDAIDGLQAAAGQGDAVRLQRPAGLRAAPPAAVPAPDPAHGRGRGGTPAGGWGCWAWPAWRGMLAFGTSVASLPAVSPTEAIPRAIVARQAIEEAHALMAEVDGGGRRPRPGRPRAGGRHRAAERGLRRAASGRRAPACHQRSLNRLRDRVDAGLDRIYAVARIGEASTLVDLATPFPGVDAVRHGGRQRRFAVGGGQRPRPPDPRRPAAVARTVVYRAGQAIGELTAGEPWMIATAATDVVLVDRQRQAWRFDLSEQTPQPLSAAGAAMRSAAAATSSPRCSIGRRSRSSTCTSSTPRATWC